MPSRLVAIDTEIAIWAIKKTATTNRQDMVRHAVAFLQQLQDEKAIILIPAIVVGELLVKSSEQERQEILSRVQNAFRIIPFDAAAAVEAARLCERTNAPPAREALREANISRSCIKADCQILATAITRGAILYSEDDGIHAIAANARIDVKRMPHADPGIQELDFRD